MRQQPAFAWKQGECPFSPPLRSTLFVQPEDVKALPEADKQVLRHRQYFDQEDKATGTLLFWDVAVVRKILDRKATND